MYYRFIALLLAAYGLATCVSSKQPAQNLAGWKLSWSDEFNNNGLPDSTKWSYETGGHGWGNNELQAYTASDTSTAFVKRGILHIRASAMKDAKNPYKSARLVTRGKQHFQYGRIDVRAKLAAGRGAWPDIWMLGTNIKEAGWPLCGEIDIMEHVGYMPDSIFASVHTESYNHVKGTQKTKGIYLADPYTAFHEYSIQWSADSITFYLDQQPYLRFHNEHKTVKEWPFSQPFFLLLNVAVGGNWGAVKGIDPSVFPATMQVDYVRVYTKE